MSVSWPRKNLNKTYGRQLIISTGLVKFSLILFQCDLCELSLVQGQALRPSPANHNFLITVHWKQLSAFQWASTTELLLKLLETEFFFWDDFVVVVVWSLSCIRLFVTPWTVGFSVHGILQARILKWVGISFSRGSSWLRSRTQVSCIAGRLFTDWATREAHRGTNY